MGNHIVIGAAYGDEGKGLVSNYITGQLIDNYIKPLGVFQSGSFQRSHTSYDKMDKRHVHRIVTAGYNYGMPTYYTPGLHGVFIEPMTFMEEFEKYEISPKIFVSRDGRYGVITPADIYLAELQREDKHNSCGFGYWQAYQRCEMNYLHMLNLTYADEAINTYVDVCMEANKYYAKKYSKYDENHIGVAVIDKFMNAFRFFVNNVELKQDSLAYENIVVEDSQGLGLGLGDPEFRTTTSVGLTGAMQNELFNPSEHQLHVWYVLRTYETRHGDGPMHYELEPCHNFVKDLWVDKTNKCNEWQGALRIGLWGPDGYEKITHRIQNDLIHAGVSRTEVQLNIVFTHCNEFIDYGMLKNTQKRFPTATLWTSHNETDIERYWS